MQERGRSSAALNCTSGFASPRQLLLGAFLLADGDLFAHMDAGISAAVQRPVQLQAYQDHYMLSLSS